MPTSAICSFPCSATTEADDEDAGREEGEHLNPLERLWRKVERLEARLDQLEGDASAEE